MLKRVVVTGLGALTPLGNDVKTFWKNVADGKSGAGNITRFNSEGFRSTAACELKDFDITQHLDRNDVKRSDTFTHYAMVASDEAIQDSGFDRAKTDPFDVGVIWGSGQGGTGTYEQQVEEYAKGDGRPHFNPFLIPKFLINMASGMISIRYGFRGVNYTPVSACATSNTAIMEAFNYIRLGKAKIMITGGSEAPLTPASYGGFAAMKAMSVQHENPEKASRPFDVHRDGFVMAEGAGALVLEEYEHARQRGAHIYGEIGGAAMTADAYHMTSTHPDGLGATRAMQLALREAGISSIAEVDYLNAHATSTQIGDLSEIKAILNLTEGKDVKTKISATKSMTGHLLGAAGAVEAIICLMAVQHGLIPPTINTHELDPAIPKNLHIVLGEAVQADIKVAMSNTFGFGGHNATVVFKKI